jgi:type I restriction enzyme, S subunit
MKKEWPKVRLGEVLTRNEESIALEPDTTYREITVRLWGKGVVLRGIVTGAEVATQRRYVARQGQFILSRIDARNGALGIVPPELDGAIVINDFPVFRIAEQRLLPAYLGWVSRTASFVEECLRASEGTTNRVRLQESKFLARELPLPPLAEQRRVVARIEELAAKVHEARSLRQRAAEEADALSQAGVEASYQRLRDRVESQPLANFCETITDGDHNTPAFSETGVRFIFVGNVSTGRLHFANSKLVDEEYFKRLRPERVPGRGDILYSAVGATLGIPAVVDSDEPFCFQRHIAILKPNRRQLDGQFAWHMLRSRTVFERAWASTTGSAQPTVPLRAIRELPIPVPPLPEQRRIVSELDALQAEVDVLKRLQTETTATLNALLPAILDRAFKGGL